MRSFLQFFGVFWLILTLPVVALAFASRPLEAHLWWAYALLVVVTLLPGVCWLWRAKHYPERDLYSREVVEGSVIGGTLRLVRLILREPRGFLKALRF